MKVLDARSGLLSNFEVLDLLQSRGADKGPLSTLHPSELKVYAYLVGTPAGSQNCEAVGKFLAEIQPLQLTAAEKLQVVNNRPSHEVEVHLIVEDCDERLSSERVEQLLAAVEQALPLPPVVEGLADENGEGEQVEGGVDEMALDA